MVRLELGNGDLKKNVQRTYGMEGCEFFGTLRYSGHQQNLVSLVFFPFQPCKGSELGITNWGQDRKTRVERRSRWLQLGAKMATGPVLMGMEGEINSAGPLMKDLGKFPLYISLGSYLSEFVVSPEFTRYFVWIEIPAHWYPTVKWIL